MYVCEYFCEYCFCFVLCICLYVSLYVLLLLCFMYIACGVCELGGSFAGGSPSLAVTNVAFYPLNLQDDGGRYSPPPPTKKKYTAKAACDSQCAAQTTPKDPIPRGSEMIPQRWQRIHQIHHYDPSKRRFGSRASG